jgi:hypothetical protein
MHLHVQTFTDFFSLILEISHIPNFVTRWYKYLIVQVLW